MTLAIDLKRFSIPFIITVLSATTACTTNATTTEQEVTRILVLDNAKNIARHVSLGGARVQISYEVDLQFPLFAIGEDKIKKLQAQNWQPCHSSDAPKWDTYLDGRYGETKRVFQELLEWRRSSEILTVVMRYLTQEQTTRPEEEPQRIIILVDKFSPEQADQAQLLHGAECK